MDIMIMLVCSEPMVSTVNLAVFKVKKYQMYNCFKGFLFYF